MLLHWMVNLITDCDHIVKSLERRENSVSERERRQRDLEFISRCAADSRVSKSLQQAHQKIIELERDLELKTKQCEKLHREYSRVVDVAEKHGIVIVEILCQP